MNLKEVVGLDIKQEAQTVVAGALGTLKRNAQFNGGKELLPFDESMKKGVCQSFLTSTRAGSKFGRVRDWLIRERNLSGRVFRSPHAPQSNCRPRNRIADPAIELQTPQSNCRPRNRDSPPRFPRD